MQCEECGGVLIHHGHESFCSCCGLVYGVDTVASRSDFKNRFSVGNRSIISLGTRPRSRIGYYSASEKRLYRIYDYLFEYARNMPREVVDRAIYLAKRYYKDPAVNNNFEAFALACVEKAAKEAGLDSVIQNAKSSFVRKKARAYLRELLGPPQNNVRDRVAKEIARLCPQFGVDYVEAVELYYKLEPMLAGRAPKVAAAVVIYMLAKVSYYDVSRAADIRVESLRKAVKKVVESFENF